MQLNDAYKSVTRDQDKVLAPEETVRRFRDRLGRLKIDILDRTERIDSGRLGIPVFMSYCGADAAARTGTRKQMGKGASPEQAEASAVMELAERFSFFSFSEAADRFRTAPWTAVKNQALPFDQIARAVHDGGPDAAAAEPIFADLPLRWTPGHRLRDGAPVLLPFDWFFMINEFNGSCAGNCPEEALCQGVCEVVERHVSDVVSRERRPIPTIRPDSVTDPVARELLDKYAAAGVEVVLQDMTLDTGVPTVGALAWDPATFPEKSEIVWTAGAAAHPEKALIRALTETAQLGGDFNTGANYLASGLPKFPDLEAADFLRNAGETVAITDLPDLSDLNFRVELERLVETLAARKLEVFVLDVTHPDLGVPAFYVMIPGARFRERAARSSVALFTARLIGEQFPPPLAAEKFRQMEAILPNRYYIRFHRGMAHLAMDDPETALSHLGAALDLDPTPEDVPSIYAYMGVCFKEMARYGEALAVLNQAEALDQDRTDVHNLKGFCHFKRGEHPEAIASFQEVLRLNPGSAIDYANIGANYRAMGETEKAVEHYHIALTLDPSIEFARDHLAALTGA
jgi:ribosomal protein S12 methylthiotransferase accessory factor